MRMAAAFVENPFFHPSSVKNVLSYELYTPAVSARHMEYDEVIENLHLLCSLMTAAVFVIIAAILWKKYSLVIFPSLDLSGA